MSLQHVSCKRIHDEHPGAPQSARAVNGNASLSLTSGVYPAFISPGYMRNGAICFAVNDNYVNIQNHPLLLQSLMALCDGSNAQEAVLRLLALHTPYSENTIESAITQLVDSGVIVDARSKPLRLFRTLSDSSLSSVAFENDRCLLTEWMQRLETTLKCFGVNVLSRIVQSYRSDIPLPSQFVCESLLVCDDGQIRSAGFATGESAQVAGLKSVSEAIERMACTRVRADLTCPANLLHDPYITFDEYLPLSQEQKSKIPEIECFNDGSPWRWVRGKQLSSSDAVWIPLELVYPSITDKYAVQLVTTSGTSVELCSDGAAAAATLELIERHSLMKIWIGKESPVRVRQNVLSKKLQMGINEWAKYGFEFAILDISSSGVSVVLAAAFGNKFPYFFCGAAASLNSFADAADRAFAEAEMICHLNPECTELTNPGGKTGPAEHFDYYAYVDRRNELQWLLNGSLTMSPCEPSSTVTDLFDKLKIIYADLINCPDGLQVGRVFSPLLIPLTFGIGMEMTSHGFAPVPQDQSVVGKAPHFFA